MNSLLVRLSLAFLAGLVLLGSVTLWRVQQSSQASVLEFTQELNAPIAMYVAENIPLVKEGQLDPAALKDISAHVMMINPSVELYVLDTRGRVVERATESPHMAQPVVSLDPLKRFIETDAGYPLYADNPMRPGQRRIFSAWPIRDGEAMLGYVYAVLAGEQHRSAWASLSADYRTRDQLFVVLGALALAALAALLVFHLLTRRLACLTEDVQQQGSELLARLPDLQRRPATTGLSTAATTMPLVTSPGDERYAESFHPVGLTGDEIDRLRQVYDQLTQRLEYQHEAMRATDAERRELVAMISHDLRTPLTSLQGYLDTLQASTDDLDDAQRHCVDVASRQGDRLRRLVDQLFELSRLGALEPAFAPERFSLAEFVHDSRQELELPLQHRALICDIRTEPDDAMIWVDADIALMSRVFENLLDNALRHAPAGSSIDIVLSDNERKIVVVVSNALDEAAIRKSPRTLGSDRASHRQGKPCAHRAGLGLLIVARIVELHGGEFTFQIDETNNRAIARVIMPGMSL